MDLFKNKEFYKIFWGITKKDLGDFYLPYRLFYLTLVPFSFVCFCIHSCAVYMEPDIRDMQKRLEKYSES